MRFSYRTKTARGLIASAIWQLANYALPLAIIPYLSRVLGVEAFGTYAIGLAIGTFAILVTEWGFGLTSLHAVAAAGDDRVAANQVVWSTFFAKVVLGFVFAIGVIYSSFLVSDKTLSLVVGISATNVLGSLFNFDWVLRAREQFRDFAVASIAGRIVPLPLMFIFVGGPDDVVIAVIIAALGPILVGIISLLMCISGRHISRPDANFKMTVHRIREGGTVFASTALIALYTTAVGLVVAGLSGIAQAGIYSGADRIRRAVSQLSAPITMVFFPKAAKLVAGKSNDAETQSISLVRFQLMFSGISGALLYLFAPVGVDIFLGQEFADAVGVVRVLSVLVFFAGVNGCMGLLIMIPFGLHRQFLVCISLGCLAGFAVIVPLCLSFGAVGGALSALIAEAVVGLSMFVVLTFYFRWFRPFSIL